MEQINVFIVLGGLLLLSLFSASLFKRYQERMAEKRRRLQRLLRGVDLIEQQLFRLEGCPLPPEVERVLREDVMQRYRRVKGIHARYQGIDAAILEAEQLLNSPPSQRQLTIRDGQHLRMVTASMNEVISFIQQGRLLTPLKAAQQHALIDLIGTRRNEAVYRFHRQQAEELEQQGRLKDAVKHWVSLRSYLYDNGPSNEQTKRWYEEAGEMKKRLEGSI